MSYKHIHINTPSATPRPPSPLNRSGKRVWLAGADTSIKKIVETKHVFCRDKIVLVATNMCSSWQNFCRDKYLLFLLVLLLFIAFI